MKTQLPSPPGFWKTVRLLLAAAGRRAAGRRRRQQQLLRERSKGRGIDWGPVGFVLAVLVMIILNGVAAFVVRAAVASGVRVEAERQGKIVVSPRFLKAAEKLAQARKDSFSANAEAERWDELPYSREAERIAEAYGGTKSAIEQKLRDAVRNHGTQDLIADRDTPLELPALAGAGAFPAMLGSLVLLWWGVMLVFQGEGLELDLQRRRHPMWEWLFSHPVPSGAIFFAEMLSPMAANPIYWGGPLFAGILYSFVYGPELGLLAFFLVGLPVTVAAACLGKAVEIGVFLRFTPRSRGAMIGLMSWMGYTSMMLFFVGLFFVPQVIGAIWKFLNTFAVLPWPWLRLFLGGQSNGSFSFLSGVLTCWAFAGITIAAAVWFSVWGAQQGLSGNLGRTDSRPAAAGKREPRFGKGKEPLYRKEFLWFIRDRSAIVQAILIPLTVASYQLFNLRGILRHAQGSWNYLCGAAILFGTYFLWILGPKSLSSEGTALWMALTWPRGLESLLKAKAWLWSLISSGLVLLVLAYAAFLYPASIWKIALVGIGWFLFARSMAEKSVTLVTVAASSGEQQQVHWGRRWAAQLGMLTFSIGILTQQWQLAVVGIVYSFVTAAAMWENFRARLPYLYDPWSEKLPPPPTLMHAMIAISILVEGGAVITGILIAFAGRDNLGPAMAIGYATCAVGVSIGVASFLGGRGVSLRDVWRWPAAAAVRGKWDAWLHGNGTLKGLLLVGLPAGAIGGFLLGLVAKGYLALLEHFPATAEIIHKSQQQMAQRPGLRMSYAIMAVAFAPFAEEYLFRGLLFRALDREWGGWRAVVGSAAFFAVYHPPLSWLPVGLLAVSNSVLFKKTGWLLPAVVLHMVYNAVVVMT